MNDIISAISSVGFPIVMCLLLGYYIFKIQEKSNSIIEENTTTLTKLSTLIERLFNRLDEKEDDKN